ncbi:MAG: hypothetical protein GY772_05285, partial [bacterium]|nr:hypothetical protein [bacterium]
MLATNYDVAVVCEARIPVHREATALGACARAGWNAVIHSASRGPGGEWVGGFLVAVRGPRNLCLVPRKTAPGQFAARWCHVAVEDGSPSQAIHFFPVYCPHRGSGGHLAHQDRVLSHVFEEASAFGEVPIAVLGDFNTTPEESRYLQALGPSWQVLAQTCPSPTVVPSHPEAALRRLDYAVANWPYAAMASSEHVDVTAPTRPHHPVSHVLQCGGVAVRRYVAKPKPLLSEETRAAERFGALAPSFAGALSQACHERDVDAAWSLWCSWAEAALGDGPLGPCRPPRRGRSLAWQERPAAAPQVSAEWGASTQKSRLLLLAHRRVRALHRLRSLPLERRRWGEESQVASAAARSLLQLGAAWSPWALGLAQFSALQLQVIDQELYRSLGTSLRDTARERSQGWRSYVASNLARHPGRIFAWCKGHIPLVRGVASATEVAISPNEVADLVQAHWDKWWDAPALGDGAALRGLAAAARASALPPLQGSRLRDIVRKVPVRKASGPDNWAFAELRLLPVEAFDALATVLSLVESVGEWPVGLTGASVSLIPKPGAVNATDLRPIGLMPVVYRLWAVARQDPVRAWLRPQEHFILGGRPGVGADIASLEASIVATEALASGDQVAAAFCDISKAYEGIDHALLAAAALAHGFPPLVAHLAISAYRGPRRVVLSGTPAAKCTLPKRGVIAGCPVA